MEYFSFTSGESKGGLTSVDGFNGSGALYSITLFASDLSISGFSGSIGFSLLWADLVQPYNINKMLDSTFFGILMALNSIPLCLEIL